MVDYINPPIGPTDPDDIAQAAFDSLADNIPGYEANDNSLDAWLIMALARIVATGSDVASAAATGIFRYFGGSVVGLQPIADVASECATTWTMVDDSGYTIPAGTNCGFQITGDTLIPFVTVDDVIVAPGDTVTSTGGVLIQAVDAGSATNGLDVLDFVLVDALAFVASVVAEGSPAGGIDGETDAQYLQRLVIEFQTFTQTPVLGTDAGVLARNVAGVFRAVGVDNYNPLDDTDDNERMIAVACVDALGQPVSGGIKTAVAAYLESLRETNFIMHVFDATYHTINVAFNFTSFSTADDTIVKAAAEAAVGEYLSPATWGVLDGDDTLESWENQTVVRYNEVVALLNNVDGLRWVNSLTLNGSAADVDMTGTVTLPEPGTVVGTPA